MSDNLCKKIRLLTLLSNQTQGDQADLLMHLLKLLEDKTKERGWNIITARRLILESLNTHHPHIDIDINLKRLKEDHKAENEKHWRPRASSPEHIYIAHYS